MLFKITDLDQKFLEPCGWAVCADVVLAVPLELLPVAEEEGLGGELPDPPGGDGEAAVDVGVVRIRRV